MIHTVQDRIWQTYIKCVYVFTKLPVWSHSARCFLSFLLDVVVVVVDVVVCTWERKYRNCARGEIFSVVPLEYAQNSPHLMSHTIFKQIHHSDSNAIVLSSPASSSLSLPPSPPPPPSSSSNYTAYERTVYELKLMVLFPLIFCFFSLSLLFAFVRRRRCLACTHARAPSQ